MFVTIGFDNVEFKKNVKGGTILKFIIEKEKEGNTSVKYKVSVFSDNNQKELVFSTGITFVCIDDNGQKKALPKKNN